MKAGGPISDSYEKYKPKGNVFITISKDGADAVYNAYKNYGQAARFPIVGNDGGSSQLTSVLNASGYVGTSYLIQPDGTFEGAYKGGSDYGVGFYLDKAKEAGPSKFTLTVTKGSGSGDYDAEEVVSVSADAPATGYMFEKWIGDTQYVANTGSQSTTVTMPDKNISIEATYVDTTTTVYTLTVTKGSGSGDYAESEVVSVTADEPQSGYIFEAWIGDTQYLSSTSNSSAKITMPAKNIAIEATFRDTSSGDIDTTNPVSIMKMAGWVGGEDTLGSSIDLDTSKLKDEKLIKADLDLTKSDEDKEEWAWVKLTAYLENNFKGVTAYKIRYKADEKVSLVLDQDNLNQAGTSYLCTLSATDDEFKTVLLTEKDFKQPSWHKEKDDLDLEKVKSLSFGAIKEETTLKLELSEVVLFNYVGEAVITTGTSKIMSFGISTVGDNLAIVVPESSDYRITIVGVDGRVLHSKSLHLRKGVNAISGITTTASAVRFIQIEGNNRVATFKSVIR